MATALNPETYVEKTSKYMRIYLILNVSEQTDNLLAKVTGPQVTRVKLSVLDQQVGGNFEC